ncbi:MAG: hypothetical protein ABR568_23450, partial [Pyrinomonadaceae bacterium]
QGSRLIDVSRQREEWLRFSPNLSAIGIRAREAWRQRKAWGVSPRTIAVEFQAREADGSGNKRDIVDEN